MPAGPKPSIPLGANSHSALLVHLRGTGRSSSEWKGSSVTLYSVPAPRQQLSGRLAVLQSPGQSASRFLFCGALSWPTSLDNPLMAFQWPRKMPAAETRTGVAGAGVNGVLPIGCTRLIGDVKLIGSSKVSDARDQRRCDISRSCEMPQRLFT